MELGSNFELDVSSLYLTEDHIFHYLDSYHTIYMDSGRNASAVLNMLIRPGVVLLPFYICESVLQVYREKYTAIFYKIGKDFTVDIDDMDDKISGDVTAVYVMHYFGQLQDREFLDYLHRKKQQYGFTIIEDTTHSIFTESRTVGDYCICSLRKWFPIMDGGVLYAQQELKEISVDDIPVKNPSAVLEAMILKKLYIQGKVDCNELYRRIFVEEEEGLDRQTEIYRISELSGTLLKYFSVPELMEKRKNNYRKLKSELQAAGIEIALKEGEFVPLACPIYAEKRDEFRRYLAEHQIYCAVHWPLVGTELEGNKEAEEIANHIISLPIDQRYGEEHMEYLANVIQDYTKTNKCTIT